MVVSAEEIRANAPNCPARWNQAGLEAIYPRFWAIGEVGLLEQRLLGLLCSERCPGDVVLKTYDLARALRDAGVPVIGGFHSPMEKECLDLLLRGKQPVVVCPARSIERFRIPAGWKKHVEAGRMLIISPFQRSVRRPTGPVAAERNRIVVEIAQFLVVPHASPGGKVEKLCRGAVVKKSVFALESEANAHLTATGAKLVEPENVKLWPIG